MPLPAAYADAEYNAAHEEMVRRVERLIRAFGDDILPDQEWIIGKLRILLRTGGLADQQHIIANARGGDLLSHEALMREFHEMLNERATPPVSLCAYAAERDLHPQRGKGAAWWVNYRRDFWISFWVRLICKLYGIAATRNSEPRPNRSRKHCGAAVVADALTRSGHGPITEKTVANVYTRPPVWDRLGLPMNEHIKIIVAEVSQRQLNPRQAIEKCVPD